METHRSIFPSFADLRPGKHLCNRCDCRQKGSLHHNEFFTKRSLGGSQVFLTGSFRVIIFLHTKKLTTVIGSTDNIRGTRDL